MVRVKILALLAMAWAALSTAGMKAEELKMASQQLELTVEIPRLKVAEYHRPYVAIWIQGEKPEDLVNLAVWYQLKNPTDDSGHKWLPDLRTWWRRTGRGLEFPVDAVSAPTRPVGEHTLTFGKEKLAALAPGKYTLFVEAVREVGGRELLEIPFQWPSTKDTKHQVTGKKELGGVTLIVKP